jgi:hypothetical protein
MMAIWPVGPPKLMKPSFSQKRKASAKVGCARGPGVAARNLEMRASFLGAVNQSTCRNSSLQPE